MMQIPSPDTGATWHVSPPGCGHHNVPGAVCGTAGGARPRCPLSAVPAPHSAVRRGRTGDQQPPAATSTSSQQPILTAAAAGSAVFSAVLATPCSLVLGWCECGQVPWRRVPALQSAARRTPPPHSRPRPGRCGCLGSGLGPVLLKFCPAQTRSSARPSTNTRANSFLETLRPTPDSRKIHSYIVLDSGSNNSWILPVTVRLRKNSTDTSLS